MKKFKVTIIVPLAFCQEVEANTEDEAKVVAKEKILAMKEYPLVEECIIEIKVTQI